MGNKGFKTTDRDVLVLQWLWKWKVATTTTLHAKFFSNTQPITAYKRLMAMERAGHIECVLDNKRRNFAWQLTRQHFKHIVHELHDSLAEVGFKSENIAHDLIVNAAQVGEWLKQRPSHVEYVTEQRMRRFHPELLPECLPKLTRHRPDGFWIFENSDKPKVISLEVELSSKKKSDYYGVGDWYKFWSCNVQSVIWIVHSLGLAKTMEAEFKRATRVENQMHNFILLSDFLKLGWHSKVVQGPNINQVMGEILDGEFLEKTPQPNLAYFLLDTRKSPIKPTDLSTLSLERSFLMSGDMRPKSN